MSALALVVGLCSPIIHQESVSWIESLDYTTWNQTDNYEKNGFIIGFLYNLGKSEVSAPADYSSERIASIAAKYRAIKAADTSRVAWDEKLDNLIIILAETFYDPSLLTEYYSHTGGDVTPNLHAIFRDYPSGYMYSPEYGGGTANVEFEVQTGLTNYWAMTTPYVNLVPKLSTLISPAQLATDYDFASTGIHSYDGTMYKRHLAYRTMGYGDFLDESDFTHIERESHSSVLNDRSIYLEILDLLAESDGPQLISAITMQNHAPYLQPWYDTFNFRLYQREGDWESIESNYQSLYYSDKYLAEFLSALDDLDERTTVLWFGDHAMGILDKYAQSDKKSERDLSHITPYFIYTNFDLKNPYTVSEVAKLNSDLGFKFPTKSVDLPTTSPNCLLNTTYNLLNIEKPTFFYLLDAVCTETPIFAHAYSGEEGYRATSTLREYELVNYDILYGNHYWDGLD